MGAGFWEGLVPEGVGSGTSEQLGMQPRRDPTVRTAPCPNRG